ncbi:hypothetical protein ACRAKI_18635 [Saccharothrix isguenensis]
MIRTLKTLLALSALIGPFMLLGGGAANADPYWAPVTRTSAFKCSLPVPHPFFNVTFESCVVVNSTATQAVAIISDHGTSAVPVEAPHVELHVNGSLSYDRSCLPSTLSGGYTRACFGPTQTRPCGTTVQAWATVGVQGWFTGTWSQSRPMCT